MARAELWQPTLVQLVDDRAADQLMPGDVRVVVDAHRVEAGGVTMAGEYRRGIDDLDALVTQHLGEMLVTL